MNNVLIDRKSLHGPIEANSRGQNSTNYGQTEQHIGPKTQQQPSHEQSIKKNLRFLHFILFARGLNIIVTEKPWSLY